MGLDRTEGEAGNSLPFGVEYRYRIWMPTEWNSNTKTRMDWRKRDGIPVEFTDLVDAETVVRTVMATASTVTSSMHFVRSVTIKVQMVLKSDWEDYNGQDRSS